MDNPRQSLNDKELSTLDKFRDTVKDVLKSEHDDHYLLRWLRARDFNIQKSEEMLRKSVAWRKKWGADRILTDWEPPEVMKEFYPGGSSGFDEEGCPIWIFPSGDLDMKGISMSVKKSEIIRYNIYIMETLYKQLKDQTQKLGKRVDKAILIKDLDRFTVKQLFAPGMDIILKFLAMIEANYPETLKHAYIINGPMIFPIIFKMVKPLLSEHTKRKIVILGKDWKSNLQQALPSSQYPEHWGGSMTDPDGNVKCQSLVGLGGTVPSDYFVTGPHMVDKKKVSQVTIASRSCFEVAQQVMRPRQGLKYIFWTDTYDIKYEIYYKENVSSRPAVLQQATRVNCHLAPEDGFFQCDKAGTYVLKFDNTYSWVHSKNLSYFVEVVDAEGLDGVSAKSSSASSSAADLTDVSTPTEEGNSVVRVSPTEDPSRAYAPLLLDQEES